MSDGAVEQASTVAEIESRLSKEYQSAWIDLEQPDEGDVRQIAALFDIDDEAVEDSLAGEQRPRVDEYDTYFVLMMYGLLRGDDPADTEPRKLTLVVGSKWLITVHLEPVVAVRTVRRQITKKLSTLGLPSSDAVAHRIIDKLADRYERVAGQYEEELERLEEISLNGAADGNFLSSVSELRWQLLELRRLAASQIELLAPIAGGELDYVSEAISEEFRHVRDHFLKVLERMDSLRELLRGVVDNYRATLAMRANDIVRVLTVYAAVVLPLTLIAGIFGMNLPLWPVPEQPVSFWTVIAIMLAFGGGLLMYFRRKGWL